MGFLTTEAREELQVSSDHDLQWLSDIDTEGPAELCVVGGWSLKFRVQGYGIYDPGHES